MCVFVLRCNQVQDLLLHVFYFLPSHCELVLLGTKGLNTEQMKIITILCYINMQASNKT